MKNLRHIQLFAQIELGKKPTSLDGWVNWLELTIEQIMAKNLKLLQKKKLKRCTFIKKQFLDCFYNKGLIIIIYEHINNES